MTVLADGIIMVRKVKHPKAKNRHAWSKPKPTKPSVVRSRSRAVSAGELLRAKEALERKTIELALSLSMMQATLDSTTDAIVVTDMKGNVQNF
ncbi:MAG TPA: hypothetical protein VJ721_04860, partial [Chthoniobacterales bacterium]|nr:hypothetical protein [Chthoniobacterales bacterium]